MITFGDYASIPLVDKRVEFKPFPFNKSPYEVFRRIQLHYDSAYILESVTGPSKLAEYSFIGFNPRLIVTVSKESFYIDDRRAGEKVEGKADDPLSVVKSILEPCRVDERRFRFIGGAVGYVSYDSIRYWERLPSAAENSLNFPDLEFGVFDQGIVFDHLKGRAFYYHIGEDGFEETINLVKEDFDVEELNYTEPTSNIDKDRFEEMVSKAKDYVSSGDIFQVVLSKRYELKVHGDPLHFYSRLREINPSPYMYFIKMGDRKIVGSSPEMLVRVDGGVVETFPIAGTRPRRDDEEENRALTKELLADPKERAEHLMLVDLARNDLGRVSKFGSVCVPEFMQVHQFSHVQHIVSHVKGMLNDECDSYDALRAVFPAGTVSGAPKVRAMEIIEELEPVRRGPYAGAVGYFSYNGNADFAITIRTLIAQRDRAYIQAGAGIVADSIPEREWFETEHKAQVLIKALTDARGYDS